MTLGLGDLLLWIGGGLCCFGTGIAVVALGFIGAAVLWGNGVRTLGERRGP